MIILSRKKKTSSQNMTKTRGVGILLFLYYCTAVQNLDIVILFSGNSTVSTPLEVNTDGTSEEISSVISGCSHNISHSVLKNNTNTLTRQDLTALIGDLCLFGCLWCQYESHSYFLLCHHVRIRHMTVIPDMRLLEDDAESYAKQLVLTKCKICHYSLPHDSHCISLHLRKKHKSQNVLLSTLIFDYVAIDNHNKAKELVHDFKSMQQCFVIIRESKYLQYFKDRDPRSFAQVIPENVNLIPTVPPLKRVSNPKGSLPDNLTTHKVGNFCVFACDKCDFKTTFWGGLRNHIFHCDCGPGNSKYDTKYVKEARYHKCAICAGIIICDTTVIKTHITVMHGYTLDKYLDVSKSMMSSVQYKQKQKRTEKKMSINSQHNDSLKTFSSSFANLCSFKCDQCDFTCRAWNLLKNHVKLCQGTSSKKRLIAKNYLLKTVYHPCKLCGKTFLCDRSLIRGHIYGAHDMCAKEYAAIGLKKKQPIVKTIKVVDKNATHVYDFKVFSENLSSNFKGFVLPKGHIGDKDMISIVVNLCVYKCIYCNFKAESWEEMSSHVARLQHSDNIVNCFHGDFIQEAVYHKCFICAKGVLSDKELIRRHIRLDHRLSLERYMKHKQRQVIKKEAGVEKQEKFMKYYTKLPKFVPQNKISSFPSNNCMFICDTCLEEKKNWPSLRNHKRNVHGEEDFFKFAPMYVKQAMYYQCPFCDIYMLCDRYVILNHMYRHKMRTWKKFNVWLANHNKGKHDAS